MRISRRAALASAGITITLPWLEAFNGNSRQARAAADVTKRAVFMFEPNGYIQEEWVPTGTENDFALGPSLAALEPHIQDIIVLDGVSNLAAKSGGPGDGHQRGMGSMLTGQQLATGPNKGAGLAKGISVDQEMVKQLQPPTKFPSLELGVESRMAGTVWGYSSYRAPEEGLPPESSPAKVFERLFSDAPAAANGAASTDTGAVDQLNQDRKSVLDAVMLNYEQLNPKLGLEDRAKLDSHLQTIRELEQRIFLEPAGGGGASCATPEAPAGGDYGTTGRQQMDLLAMALACDLTRISTFQWSNSFGDARPIEDITTGHHTLSHDSGERVKLARIDTWYAEQFAYLLDKLKSFPEGDGTLLDNTLILWSNENSKGWEHNHDDMPFILAGRAGGALQTGRFLKYDGKEPHQNLLVSLLNLMDVPATTFGRPESCTGELPLLVV